MSLLEIRCPSCKGILWVDPGTGKVVDHRAADQQKVDFGDFLKSQGKDPHWDEKIKKAREEEARRKAEIEAKFKKAKDSPDELGPQALPPINWD